jgi:predicted Fe-Mo cluster-binding NifX family protein
MKIAVAAMRKNECSEISVQAGRAPYYLIFTEDGKLLETVSNPFKVGGGGAGFGVAKMLADIGVDTVIAGKFGANMIGALKERGLQYHEMTGVIKDSIPKVK